MTVTPQTNTTLEEIARRISELDDFVICGHVNPDGDCLGSQLALAHALRSIGKRATCVLVKDDPIDPNLRFMPGADSFVPAASYAGPARAFVALDVPTRERIGEAACALLDGAAFSVAIDHHAVDTTMADLTYVDPDSASASLLVWRVCKALCGGKPPVESALCAYTGLVTDTGCFQFQNANADAFACAADLVSAGADNALVARNTMQNRTLASIRLSALAVDRMRFTRGGSCAVSWVTRADMDRLGAVKSDVEPVVNTLRALSGVKACCMLREQDGSVRGSLRAKGPEDVAAVAQSFGGGGHKAAAGCSIDLPVGDAVDAMLSAFEKAFEGGASADAAGDHA